jgi:hypothetical protein
MAQTLSAGVVQSPRSGRGPGRQDEAVGRRSWLWDAGDGEEFEVTPNLIWVTFSPTDELVAEVDQEQGERAKATTEEADPPGNQPGPRQARPARASTSCRHTSIARLALR